MHDQHFLVDKGILSKIVESACLISKDKVLEIGVGDGRMTKELCSRSNVIGVEIDRQFNVEDDNLEMHYGNALELIDSLEFNKVVSNIPYSITEALFKKLIKRDLDLVVLLIGKNFYDLLLEDGKWGKIIPVFYKVEKICDVSKDCFDPKPRVDSVVVKLVPRESLNEKERLLKEFVLQDDKKVKNALREAFVRIKGMTKKEANLEVMKFPLNLMDKNVDYLSNEEFGLIFKSF